MMMIVGMRRGDCEWGMGMGRRPVLVMGVLRAEDQGPGVGEYLGWFGVD